MAFITIVTGAYKPTYILVASHCSNLFAAILANLFVCWVSQQERDTSMRHEHWKTYRQAINTNGYGPKDPWMLLMDVNGQRIQILHDNGFLTLDPWPLYLFHRGNHHIDFWTETRISHL